MCKLVLKYFLTDIMVHTTYILVVRTSSLCCEETSKKRSNFSYFFGIIINLKNSIKMIFLLTYLLFILPNTRFLTIITVLKKYFIIIKIG